MRLRPALLALASAFTLAFSVSTSAHAATETGVAFSYHDRDGDHSGHLEGQVDNCIDIPELQASETNYAFAPQNTSANAYVDVYEDLECKGTKTTLRPDQSRDKSLQFRSVIFRPMG
ncbi:hypothetical protein [Streptomyces puniciscabiei]|uniref:hypothetical protein n=1 Tax=Streptomyces puniciscabiei TaxID=164348 RepID=UPI0006EB94F3|nr:hypothetical protein [Streptomyces puniciscabiei]